MKRKRIKIKKNNNLNKIKIISNENLLTDVYLNDKKLKNVTGINFSQKPDEIPKVNIELATDNVKICLDRAWVKKKESLFTKIKGYKNNTL